MFSILIGLAVVAAFAYRVLTPSELQLLEQKLQPIVRTLDEWRSEAEPFRAALRTKRRWLVITPTLLALNGGLFACVILFGDSPGALSLLEWGATQGMRAASGEWWRLVSATFVHDGLFHLIVTTFVIVQLGTLLERLVGPFTLASAYVAAGALGHAVIMSGDVTNIHAGATSATFGLYGVLLATSLWGFIWHVETVLPRAQYKLLTPGAVLVVISTVMTYGLDTSHCLAGLAVGFIIGLAGAMKATRAKVTLGPVAFATSVALIVIAGAAIPVRSLVSVRSQLVQLVTIEDGTADKYREVLRGFLKAQKRIDAAVLTKVIDESIVPQLTRAAEDVAAMKGVMPEHQPLVASAVEYLRLREASWKLRAEGLRKGNMRLLQQADAMEQKSMEALRPLKDLRPLPAEQRPAALNLS